MSCESNSNSVCKRGAVAAGISPVANKAGFSYGAVLNNAARVTRQGINTGVEAFYKFDEANAQGKAIGAYMLGVAGSQPPEQGFVKKTAKGAVKGATLGAAKLALQVGAFAHPGVRLACKIAKSVQLLSRLTGSGVAALTKTGEAGKVMQEKRFLMFFKKQVPVGLWKSSLTSSLNRYDVVGDPSKILSSEGVMFRPSKAVTWHRGTTVVKMPDGKRTITHLQSLALPQSHYYFNRPISDEASVGIAVGSINPETVPGYVAKISEFEGISPNWMMAKHALIKSYLHYGAKN